MLRSDEHNLLFKVKPTTIRYTTCTLYILFSGAFLIPFVVMIILCGFPLYFLEYSLSKFSGRGPYKIWDISPVFRGNDSLSALIDLLMYMYKINYHIQKVISPFMDSKTNV